MANTNVSDDKMMYLDDDLVKVQTKPNMYIQEYGDDGVAHLGREIAQNNFDECLNPKSNGRHINIEYDQLTDMLSCEDDGRGFPEADYPLEIFCTKLQSGSKFYRTQGGGSSGEFGVGLTVVNALSDEFIIQSLRKVEKTIHTIKFENGKMVSNTIEPNPNKLHGSKIKFRVSQRYMGKGSKLPVDKFLDWVIKMMYLVKMPELRVNFTIVNGLEVLEEHKLKPMSFSNLLDQYIPEDDKHYTKKIVIEGDRQIQETIENTTVINGKVKELVEVVEKNIHLDVAFQYVRTGDTTYDSYCNFTNTTDGGTHQIAVDKAFCTYMVAKVKEIASKEWNTKYQVLWDDVRTGLMCIINLSTDMMVRFEGNAKTKIGSKELMKPIQEIITEKLDEYFKANPSQLTAYVNAIKLNTKSRVEANKIRTAIKLDNMTKMDELTINNYIPCSSRTNSFKEIFGVEGDSPAATARTAANPDTQAFYLFRGLTANPMKMKYASLNAILSNIEWKNWVRVLRCGVGPNFNLKKLYFDRVNLQTDEDIDGLYIAGEFLVFHYKWMPEIIRAGRLFRVHSPLYLLSNKEYCLNKREMIEKSYKKIIKNYKVKPIEMIVSDYFNKEDFIEFLECAYDYNDRITRLAGVRGKIDRYFLESLIIGLVKESLVTPTSNTPVDQMFDNQRVLANVMKCIQEKFPEIRYQGDNRFHGPVNGMTNLIKVDDRFVHYLNEIVYILMKYGTRIEVNNNGNIKVLTILEFLDDCLKYATYVVDRYKGLGEFNPEQLWETALDINNRYSTQYTMEDTEEELEVISLFFSDSPKYVKLRNEYMAAYKLSRHDLDN